MKVLIVSDIHKNTNLLNNILKNNQDVDLKIFLGDFQVSRKEQEKLTNLFDYVVAGNCDYPGFSPNKQLIEIDGLKIFITHGHYYGSFLKKIDFDLLYKEAKQYSADIILHGHDHIGVIENRNGILRFNPGSPTLPRGNTKATYGLMEIEKSLVKNIMHIKV